MPLRSNKFHTFAQKQKRRLHQYDYYTFIHGHRHAGTACHHADCPADFRREKDSRTDEGIGQGSEELDDDLKADPKKDESNQPKTDKDK